MKYVHKFATFALIMREQ